MCGIVGYIGFRDATEVLLDGLRRLEYRGYDSAGIAVRTNGDVTVKRSVGKLIGLEMAIASEPPKGHSGIGHTRWATHGRPSETNAHPHRSENIILVHNGIIENYAELRQELKKDGHTFSSETDTEIACHLISTECRKAGGDTAVAIKETLKRIDGSFAFVIMDENNPDEIYIAKDGSPLVVGIGKEEVIIASDIPAILPYTKEVVIIEDGEFGVIRRDGIALENADGKKIDRKPRKIDWDHVQAEKGGFKHFMLKEIFEQPKVIADTIAGRIVKSDNRITLPELKNVWGEKGFPFNNIHIVACGTSSHAALVGKYWIEKICRVPVTVDLASEFRYRDPIIDKNSLLMAISQSGETADTLASVKLAKSKGSKVVSICNVVDSSIPRASDATLYTRAGPEIGVASTKAFTAQLIVLLMFALDLGQRLDKVTSEFMRERIEELLRVPSQLRETLADHEKIKDIAEKYVSASQVLFIARGVHFPVALEGALKLKEISYTHAEGFAAGELKHGPIALVDYGIPILAIADKQNTYEKIMNNVEEVQARGGDVIALASKDDEQISQQVGEVLRIPSSSLYISPILYAVPLQLFAYYMADHKGTDVDQPRNLAKSVTVE
jgi:glucosamine--fructose-6-phosphate aminotransferase (isomerizing)